MCPEPGKIAASLRKRQAHQENGGVSPAVWLSVCCNSDQRSSCSTLCCDWLASASAETAIDCRVDSAWLLAASSLGSATVRLDAPVCSTLIRFLLKSWRISHDRQVRTEARCRRAQRGRGLGQLCQHRVGRVAVEEVGAGGQAREAKSGVVEGHAGDRQLRSAGLVEGQVQGIAVQQVDAVERGILRRGVDLLQDMLYCATRLARIACEFGSATGGSRAQAAELALRCCR